MTFESQLRHRLASAVDDTAVPAGLAHAAMAGGQRRRRARRTVGVAALASAAVVGGVLLIPQLTPTTPKAPAADGDRSPYAALTWARSLPEGPAPEVPFFGEGGLWSAGELVPVPDSVNRSHPPQSVAGGWLVSLRRGKGPLALAVLSPEGSLQDLPRDTYAGFTRHTRLVVSDDGDQFAYGHRLVDLETMAVVDLPHAPPKKKENSGWVHEIRVIGFADGGLIYTGAPFEGDSETTWRLGDDGSTTKLHPPAKSGAVPPGDLALRWSAGDDKSETCTTSYVLQSGAWVENGSGCMGREPGRGLGVSPDHQWLLTDDLPEVWNLQDATWHTVEMPRAVGPTQLQAQTAGVAWESDDSFLLAVADRWAGPDSSGPAFDQHVQIVRCAMSTGACERAGSEQDVRVTTTRFGPTEVMFWGF